ncbi:hypothetical protein GIS00_24590 [Nakamurella sp. YIM 132087]|uniref:YdhG-like domain-containing protein n=1 Tax=Nakamurella alba TaxID=2665158 RepID=A0A7K1FUU2_9ACTN|nr:DUF1801 domain-containing protein [Nakamurella alba]MTD17119.1 hypothetical protein [Nakamurella alba]
MAPGSVDEYLAGFDPERRAVLEQFRQAVHRAVPGVTETISYGMPTFELDGRRLVHVAGWKKHVAFYPTPGGDPEFERAIDPYRAAKAALHFRYSDPIPLPLVEQIVTLLRERDGADDSS